MRKHLTILIAALFAAALLSPIFSPAAHAQDQPAQDQSYAGTGTDSQVQPSVARVSEIRGNVSIQRGDSGDWIAATVNTPLESGDRISTGDGARAEIQLDYANVLRLDHDSTAKITDLTSDHIQIEVGQGVVNYSVYPNSRADAEIDTPNSALHPLRTGLYRIQIDSNSQTEMTVLSGQAEVSEPQGSTRVYQGQLITVQGTTNPQYRTGDAPAPDSFDQWAQNRDSEIQDAQSWHHDDRYYTGSQDLDHYGHWEDVPDYGQVWVPDQNSGWAPYRDGQWVWEPYYGWTWVSYEPWGWAPYHYGRWFVYGGNWAWWPGPIGVYGGWGYDPIWSPAYVSFFGWGGGVSFGFGFGNIGWIPCGPADYYTPWWGYGVTNITFINYVNRDRWGYGRGYGGYGRGVGDRDWGRRMNPLYRGRNGFSNIGRFANDARIREGITSMRGNQFGRGDAGFQRGLGRQQFRQATFMTGRLPAVPGRQSLGRVQARVSPAIARTAMANNRHYFTQSRPLYTPRPFNQQVAQQQRLVQNSRAQFRGGAMNGRVGANANARFNGAANGRSAPGRPFQQNTRAPMNANVRPGIAARGNAQAGAQARPGWRSFGGNANGRVQGQAGVQNRGVQNRGIQQPRGNQGRAFQPRPSGNAQPGWHNFGGNSGAARPGGFPNRSIQQPRGNAPSHNFQPRSNGNRGPRWHNFTNNGNTGFQRQGGPARSGPGNANWSRFTPQAGSRSGSARPGWNNFRPNHSYSRPGRGYGNYSRPQLNMRQPIARPRSYYGGPSRGYSSRPFNGGRSYSPPRGNYSRPNFGGRSYSPPRGNYSRPNFGGGRPSYGGGRPSFGGGRPSFGGGRPSFGGGRPSGGGFHGGGFHGGGGRPSGGGHPGGGRPHR